MEEAEILYYKCTSCGLLFQSVEEVEHHQCQTVLELLRCNACQQLFTNMEQFSTHMCTQQPQQQQQQESLINNNIVTAAQHVQPVKEQNETLVQYIQSHEQQQNESVAVFASDSQPQTSGGLIVMDTQSGSQLQGKSILKVLEQSHFNGETVEYAQSDVNQSLHQQEQQQNGQVLQYAVNDNSIIIKPENDEALNQQHIVSEGNMQRHSSSNTFIKQEDIPADAIIIKVNDNTQQSAETQDSTGEEHEENSQPPQTPAKECSGCDKKFLSVHEARRHQRQHRAKCLRSCYHCNRYFCDSRKLYQHVRLFHSKQHLQCGDDMNKSETIGSLDDQLDDRNMQRLGINIPDETDAFKCRFCLGAFESKIELDNHELCVHQVRHDLYTKRPKKQFKRMLHCYEKQCRRKFRSRLPLLFHIRTHLGLKLASHKSHKYACKQCGFKAARREAYQRHKSCHRLLPLQCVLCNVAFTDAGKIHAHRRRIHPPSDNACSTCDKVFKSVLQLTRHTNIFHSESATAHSKDPSNGLEEFSSAAVSQNTVFYYCNICYAVFTDHSVFEAHAKNSQNKHNLTCACTLTFSSEDAYQQHLRMHHPTTRPGYKEWKKKSLNTIFTCQYCGSDFKQKLNLKMHIMKFHANQGQKPLGRDSRKSMEVTTPVVTLKNDKPCIVTVTQQGQPVPVTTANPYPRILNVQLSPAWSQQSGATRRRNLHSSIYSLRSLLEEGMVDLPAPLPTRPYSSLFEQLLQTDKIQKALSELEDSATGCSITFSLPFPDELGLTKVWVNFCMTFEPDG